ncbi:MAG: hypothetical protein Kow0074_18510 [Candidatus Zixiibacteriota bacterium]
MNFFNVIMEIRRELETKCPLDKLEAELSDSARNWYEWKGLKYFLYEYEESLAMGQDIQVPWRDVSRRDTSETIEHILPQVMANSYWRSRFSDEEHGIFVNNLGNLALTTRNSQYGNRSFPEKTGNLGNAKHTYKNSSLFMLRKLSELDDWTPDEINRRHAELTAWAKERWSEPPLTQVKEFFPFAQYL